jgi:leucyl aminopeptidase
MKGTSLKWQTQLITHSSVNQKSLRLTLTGSQRPSEIVVIGGHLDSIADWGMSSTAPGADDNASGSGSIFEALRVLKDQPQPERTIEFYWYGGEELGLLGSEDIANQYKAQNKNVIAVLQLDMTAYKGEGDNVIGSAQDFTSGFLRDYLLKINDVYGLGLKIVPFKCGYGCSDHASWYSEGYPTLMPFESTMASMNRNIHTRRDTIDLLNFTHAAHFSKIALVFAMDFGNSTMKESN